MKGKPTRGRRRIEMLHDLENDGGYVTLKRAAEDREGWRQKRTNVINLLCSRRLLMIMMMKDPPEMFSSCCWYSMSICVVIGRHIPPLKIVRVIVSDVHGLHMSCVVPFLSPVWALSQSTLWARSPGTFEHLVGSVTGAPCGFRVERIDPFPGQMSPKATKPGSVCLLVYVFQCVLCCWLRPLWLCCIISCLYVFTFLVVLSRFSVAVMMDVTCSLT